MYSRLGLYLTFVALIFAVCGAGIARALQVPVVEGPLTRQCPFGICSVTNQARSLSDFYQLFGYLPEPYASQYGTRNTPPSNWPKTYYTPTRAASAPSSSTPALPKNRLPHNSTKNKTAPDAPKSTLPHNTANNSVASAVPKNTPPRRATIRWPSRSPSSRRKT